MDSGSRLQKALAALGLASRRQAEEWIRAGRLTVNGQPASLGMRVRESDQIRLDGRLVRQRPAAEGQVLIAHRSPGESLRPGQAGETEAQAAAAPEGARVSLIERLPKVAGRRFITVSPMPRIDGGLELLTSDGALAEQLQRAVRRLTAEFHVRVLGELDAARLTELARGVLDRGVALEVLDCQPAGGEGTNHWYTLTVRGASGKDVRQLFERQGARVSRVLRTRLGPIVLERALARGRFRHLTPGEMRSLLAASSAGPPQEAAPAPRSSPRSPRGSPGRAARGRRA